MLKEIFLAARDGRVLSFDLLPLEAGGLPVCATAARIATHAHAMPCATQPAVTQASPILFGCRVHAGQVHSAEGPHDGGLLAERVAFDGAVSLYLSEAAREYYCLPGKSKDIIVTAQKKPVAWDGAREHGRDRAGSSGPGPILEHAQDSQHG